jgi:hypothetical protein
MMKFCKGFEQFLFTTAMSTIVMGPALRPMDTECKEAGVWSRLLTSIYYQG